MPLKHCQAWGIDHLSRKPVPGFDTLLVKKHFLLSGLTLPWQTQCWAVPTRPGTGHQGAELGTSLSMSPPQEVQL